jgi:hypothetical protein
MAGGGSSDGRSPRIDLVPIIDAMTCVIFFLLLSSTFVEFTKITMPQAVSSVAATSVATDPPLSPRLIGVIKDKYINMVLSWSGKKPDQITKRVLRDPNNGRSGSLEATTQGIVQEFKRLFPEEKTLLLGFSPQVTYQEMISSMDGARQEINDLVMVSWTEAKAVEEQAAAAAKVEQ